MAILHRPGTVLTYCLPSDVGKDEEEQTLIQIRVPDEGTLRKLTDLAGKSFGKDPDPIELVRAKLGYYVEDVINLKFSDGSEFELKKDRDGKLTRECAIELSGISEELADLCERCSTLTGDERKNCK